MDNGSGFRRPSILIFNMSVQDYSSCNGWLYTRAYHTEMKPAMSNKQAAQRATTAHLKASKLSYQNVLNGSQERNNKSGDTIFSVICLWDTFKTFKGS